MDVDVAIVGGGFGGVYCAKALCKGLGAAAAERVALISDENYMVFQPMLPEVAGGAISPRHVISPLRLLCRPAQVLKAQVEEIRLKDRELILNAGPFSGNITLVFRHLVLALGSEVDLSRVPGMSEHGFLMRNVGDAMYLRTTIIGRIEEANLEARPEVKQRLLTFVVVGGGYSGVETAGHILDLFRSMHRFYPNVRREELVVYLVHSRDFLLQTLNRRLGEYTARRLQQRGLRLLLNERVKAVTADRVYLGNGTSIESNTVVATVGNTPHSLVQKLCQTSGFDSIKDQIVTDKYCRVAGGPAVWAVGDCAAVPLEGGGFCPATAQFAMRQGQLTGANILRAERSQSLEPFTFRGLGEMASIGHRTAVAHVFGMNFSGFFAWWLWRTVYLAKLPRLDRKIRVVLDWTLDLFFPRDINHLSPRVSTVLQEIYLEPGDILFQKGEPAFSFYIVKDGALELSDGASYTRRISEGDYFGEATLLETGVWDKNARAAEPTRLVAIPAEAFHQIISGSGSLAKFFRKSAGKYKLRETMQLLGRRAPSGFLERPVSEFMQREVYSFSSGMSVQEALRVAREHPRSSYPVIDGAGKLLGVLEREDFYEFIKDPRTHAESSINSIRLSGLPLYASTAKLRDALSEMMRLGANKAIIIDDAKRPAGIITILDILAASCSDAFESAGSKPAEPSVRV